VPGKGCPNGSRTRSQRRHWLRCYATGPGPRRTQPAKQAAPTGTSGIIPHARGGAGPVNRAEQRRQRLRDEIKRKNACAKNACVKDGRLCS